MVTENNPSGSEAPTGPEKSGSRLRRPLARLAAWLAGGEYHYAGYIPKRPGFLLRHTLDPYFSRVEVNPRYLERLQELARKGAVVYALKYRSHSRFPLL